MPGRQQPKDSPVIVRSEDVCGNRPRIAGTRITVDELVEYRAMILDELVTERILRSFPHLSTEQVQAAFEYYRAHSDEIDALLLKARAFQERNGQLPPAAPTV